MVQSLWNLSSNKRKRFPTTIGEEQDFSPSLPGHLLSRRGKRGGPVISYKRDLRGWGKII